MVNLFSGVDEERGIHMWLLDWFLYICLVIAMFILTCVGKQLEQHFCNGGGFFTPTECKECAFGIKELCCAPMKPPIPKTGLLDAAAAALEGGGGQVAANVGTAGVTMVADPNVVNALSVPAQIAMSADGGQVAGEAARAAGQAVVASGGGENGVQAAQAAGHRVLSAGAENGVQAAGQMAMAGGGEPLKQQVGSIAGDLAHGAFQVAMAGGGENMKEGAKVGTELVMNNGGDVVREAGMVGGQVAMSAGGDEIKHVAQTTANGASSAANYLADVGKGSILPIPFYGDDEERYYKMDRDAIRIAEQAKQGAETVARYNNAGMYNAGMYSGDFGQASSSSSGGVGMAVGGAVMAGSSLATGMGSSARYYSARPMQPQCNETVPPGYYNCDSPV